MRTFFALLLCAALVAAPAAAQNLISRHIYYPPTAALTLEGLSPSTRLIEVRTADGLALKGLEVAPAPGMPTLLVFHGNASSASGALRWFAPMLAAGYGMVAAEYRGYSGNPGYPDEAGLAADADAFLLRAQALAGGGTVWVVGHSLGGGAALGLARRRTLDAVFTIGTFTRVRDMAPAVARMFMANAYDNLAAVRTLDEPFHLIHGTADATVSLDHGRALFEAARMSSREGAAFLIQGGSHRPRAEDLLTIFEAVRLKTAHGAWSPERLKPEVVLVPFGAGAPVPF